MHTGLSLKEKGEKSQRLSYLNLEGEWLSSTSRDFPDFGVKIRITPLDAEADSNRGQVHINDWYLEESNFEPRLNLPSLSCVESLTDSRVASRSKLLLLDVLWL